MKLSYLQKYRMIFSMGAIRSFWEHWVQQVLSIEFLAIAFVVCVIFVCLEKSKRFSRHPDQQTHRRDFGLDFFYNVFNLILFPLMGFEFVFHFFSNVLEGRMPVYISEDDYRFRLLLLTCFFVARDFVQYWIHRLLHTVPMLWRVHQVHHSVEKMGFLSLMRFHPLETVVYRTLEYVPLAGVGLAPKDYMPVYVLSLCIGYFAHSNLNWDIGFLKPIFNNPHVHAWHHAKKVPIDFIKTKGMNFGISLNVWDKLFGTYHLPKPYAEPQKGIEEKLGKTFWKQLWLR